MNISILKTAWYCATGRAGKAADCLLDVANDAFAKIDPERKETISAALNTAMKAMGILDAIAWLIPTKWQRAYRRTLEALECAVAILDDFSITGAELDMAKVKFSLAVASWKEPDDPTCVTLDDIEMED